MVGFAVRLIVMLGQTIFGVNNKVLEFYIGIFSAVFKAYLLEEELPIFYPLMLS